MEHPEFKERFFNPDAELPYGVTPEEVKQAIIDFYEFYQSMNEFLYNDGYGRIEYILRANNALSDFVGDIVTQNLGETSAVLVKNQKPDGFPDLIPPAKYEDLAVHHGAHGIETKCSKQSGGWQAHNNEEGWFIVFRYDRGDPEDSPEDMAPLRFVQVLATSLDEDDWSHSGRSEESRRTITSSIVASGMHKLRSNPIYEDPDYITGTAAKRREYERNHAQFDPEFSGDEAEEGENDA